MQASRQLRPEFCEAVGYLLRIDHREIVLAMAMSADDETNGRLVIPRDWVQKMRKRR